MSDRIQCTKCKRNIAQKDRNLCRACQGKGRSHTGKKSYKQYKKDHCEDCGLMPKHKCLLDVDHLDSNHENNDPTNLITRCANCHRVKTCENGDSRNLRYRSVILTTK